MVIIVVSASMKGSVQQRVSILPYIYGKYLPPHTLPGFAQQRQQLYPNTRVGEYFSTNSYRSANCERSAYPCGLPK